MKKLNYYVGSNNSTHELEKDKALSILASYYEGMSTSELIGYWKGQQVRRQHIQHYYKLLYKYD